MVKTLKKLLSCVLAVSLVMSMVCVTALAETEQEEDSGSAATLARLVEALPEEVTADNAAEVKQQLAAILAALAADGSGEDLLDTETMSRLEQMQTDAEKALTPDNMPNTPTVPDLDEEDGDGNASQLPPAEENAGVAPAVEGDEPDPEYAAMVGETGYETFELALAAANGGTVTLLKPVEGPVAISQNVTLSSGTINGTVTIAANVTVTLDGVTIVATSGPGIAVGGMGVTLETKGVNSVTSTAQNYAGVEVSMGTSLTIIGDGTLTARGNGGAGVGGSCAGGVKKWLNGDITIDMTGTLEAVGTTSPTNGNYGGAGVGAASYHNPSDIKDEVPGAINIKKGTIEAHGGNSCAGIGGGSHTPTGAITIEGGNITAVSAGGAGIGSGSTGKGTAMVTISGGTINATGGWLAAGIGGSYKAGANVTITGGEITAKGGDGNPGDTYQGAPGIGSGYQSSGTVTISGGKVNATGGWSAPGIGSGALSSKQSSSNVGENKVEITGGTITAQGGCNAPGIGGGNATENVTVTITGGTVDAKGGTCVGSTEVAPSIGSATKNDANKIGGKYEVATTGSVTIGPGATLAGGTTVGAPEGNKYYVCTELADGTKVYKTTDNPADTVALLISDEATTAYSDLAAAVADAQAGDKVQMVTNVMLVDTLKVNQEITLDLNGKTLVLDTNDKNGLQLSGNATVTSGDGKGTVVYAGSESAVQTYSGEIKELSNLTIKADNANYGVEVYGMATLHSVKNCEITGAKIGIRAFKNNGNTLERGIGLIENTTVDAKECGIVLNLSQCKNIVNSNITGGNRGISFLWHNDNAQYPANNKITGGSVTAKNGPAIEFYDDRGVTGEAYTVTTEINRTQLSGTEANTGALIWCFAKGDVKFGTTVSNTNAVCSYAKYPWGNNWSESRWFESFDSAVAAYTAGWQSSPLTLLADVETTSTVDKRVDVNLNGHKLNGLTLDVDGTVVADGKLEVTSANNSYVVVESENNGTYTYTLREVVPVTGVTLNPAAVSLYTGNTVNLTATVAPDNADDKTVTWTSSNPAVATVDANGVVTAVGNGTATITAAVGSVSATCEVTVSTYVPPYVPTPVTAYALTITYVNPDGTTNTVTQNVTANGTYNVVSPVIEGYTADPAVVSGVMTGDLTVTVTYTANETDIGDDNPPLVETPDDPGTDIGDDDPPLAEMPDEPGTDISEPDVPLTDVPKTGDQTAIWLTLAAVSALGLAGLHIIGKRKENEM